MPRSQRSQRKSQKPAERRVLSQEGEEDLLTQPTATTTAGILEEANKMVKYILQNAGQHVIFRKADFQKHNIAKGTRIFQEVVEKATKILQEVYGCTLAVCDAEKNLGKSYMVINTLPYVNYNPDGKYEETDNNKILLLLILSHLFMSNGPVSDSSLFNFLKLMQIDVEVKHPVFGKIKDYLVQLVKLRYLSLETDYTTKKVSYTWGSRSEKEISKMEVLEFVGKMSGGRKPDTWQPQYQAAKAQILEK